MPLIPEIESVLRAVYDPIKGWWREHLGDHPAIEALRSFPEDREMSVLDVFGCFVKNPTKEGHASHKVFCILFPEIHHVFLSDAWQMLNDAKPYDESNILVVMHQRGFLNGRSGWHRWERLKQISQENIRYAELHVHWQGLLPLVDAGMSDEKILKIILDLHFLGEQHKLDEVAETIAQLKHFNLWQKDLLDALRAIICFDTEQAWHIVTSFSELPGDSFVYKFFWFKKVASMFFDIHDDIRELITGLSGLPVFSESPSLGTLLVDDATSRGEIFAWDWAKFKLLFELCSKSLPRSNLLYPGVLKLLVANIRYIHEIYLAITVDSFDGVSRNDYLVAIAGGKYAQQIMRALAEAHKFDWFTGKNAPHCRILLHMAPQNAMQIVNLFTHLMLLRDADIKAQGIWQQIRANIAHVELLDKAVHLLMVTNVDFHSVDIWQYLLAHVLYLDEIIKALNLIYSADLEPGQVSAIWQLSKSYPQYASILAEAMIKYYKCYAQDDLSVYYLPRIWLLLEVFPQHALVLASAMLVLNCRDFYLTAGLLDSSIELLTMQQYIEHADIVANILKRLVNLGFKLEFRGLVFTWLDELALSNPKREILCEMQSFLQAINKTVQGRSSVDLPHIQLFVAWMLTSSSGLCVSSPEHLFNADPDQVDREEQKKVQRLLFQIDHPFARYLRGMIYSGEFFGLDYLDSCLGVSSQDYFDKFLVRAIKEFWQVPSDSLWYAEARDAMYRASLSLADECKFQLSVSPSEVVNFSGVEFRAKMRDDFMHHVDTPIALAMRRFTAFQHDCRERKRGKVVQAAETVHNLSM